MNTPAYGLVTFSVFNLEDTKKRGLIQAKYQMFPQACDSDHGLGTVLDHSVYTFRAGLIFPVCLPGASINIIQKQ